MISVLIPAYNEVDGIFDTVKAVLGVPEVKQVVVVDDGSQDETAVQARLAGAQVISLSQNSGKGKAMNLGVSHLTQPIIALLDGDLGSSAGQLELLARPVLDGDADLTIATFPPVKKAGGFGFVKRLAREGIRIHTGLHLDAPISGQRVMRREVLEVVTPFASGYGVEVGMTIAAARHGFRVQEVPTTMSHRVTGRDWSGFRHRAKQFWHVLLVLCRSARKEVR
ncbi:MAG TPA: glycosyltransferase family 2 protein [Syntrophomonadaceae bacterium]|nr:glycosyltransferase family 2 protein [Syntrophomonadaceae bacterium]